MVLHFVDGEKGGVGKSFFTTILVEYCKDRGIDYELYEADITNPDIENAYPNEAKRVQFGFSEAQMQYLDELFEEGKDKRIIINLPSRIKQRLDYWIDQSDILELSKKEGINLCKWFVCTGQTESIKALKDSIDKYEKKVSAYFSKKSWDVVR